MTCHHCGKPDEPDGDHTCTCPYPDGGCPDHEGEAMSVKIIKTVQGGTPDRLDSGTVYTHAEVTEPITVTFPADLAEGVIEALIAQRDFASPALYGGEGFQKRLPRYNAASAALTLLGVDLADVDGPAVREQR